MERKQKQSPRKEVALQKKWPVVTDTAIETTKKSMTSEFLSIVVPVSGNMGRSNDIITNEISALDKTRPLLGSQSISVGHSGHSTPLSQDTDISTLNNSPLSNTPIPCPKRAPWFVNIIRDWWLEYFCTVLVLGTFGLLVTTLWLCNDRALEDWPLYISFNVLVSVETTVLKSAMILVVSQGLGQFKWQWFSDKQNLRDLETFDNSTRGPIGAIKLLWVAGWRSPSVSIGATIIILALALDPFAQQIIRYHSKDNIMKNAIATIPATNYFNEYGQGIMSPSLKLQQTITSGILGRQHSTTTASCPTGNCTFDETYHSLAYCSSCRDATAEIETICSSDSVCSYNLPANSNLSVPNSRDLGDGLLHTLLDASYDVSTGEHLFLLDAETIESVRSGTCKDETCVGAVSCSLEMCVRSYTAVTYGGNTSEQFISSSNNWASNGDPAWRLVNLPCAGSAAIHQLISLGYIVKPNITEWLGYYGPGYDHRGWHVNSSSTLIPEACEYRMDAFSNNVIRNWLRVYLSGSLVIVWGQQHKLYNDKGQDPQGPVQLAILAEGLRVSYQSINNTMASIADAISSYIRNNGNENYSAPAVGKVFSNQTFAHVRWGWLTLPATLVALTAIFFIMTIKTSIQMNEGGDLGYNWKNSIWPLIFGGLEPNASSGDDERELQKVATKLKASMIWTGLGWRFKTSPQ